MSIFQCVCPRVHRPSVVYTADDGGNIDVWDFYTKQVWCWSHDGDKICHPCL